jgi:hypothetical protein
MQLGQKPDGSLALIFWGTMWMFLAESVTTMHDA